MRDYSDINHRPSTGLHWRNALDRHLMPVFGDLRLNEIGLKLIDQYKRTKHEAGLMSSTINGHLRTLKRVLTLARDWEILERVPRIALVNRARSCAARAPQTGRAEPRENPHTR